MTGPEQSPSTTGPKRRRILRIVAWSCISLLLLAVLLVGGVSYYTTTADFQRRVGAEVVKVLED
jgi:translocation and assembly module TamB